MLLTTAPKSHENPAITLKASEIGSSQDCVHGLQDSNQCWSVFMLVLFCYRSDTASCVDSDVCRLLMA